MMLLGRRTAVIESEKRNRRVNRRSYVVEILLIFAVSFVPHFVFERFGVSDLWVDLGFTALLIFLIGRAFAGRSHDIGRTDNWTLIPLAFFSVGWLVSVFWDGTPLWAEIAGHLLWTLALFSPVLFRGNRGENQFGASPEEAVELKVIANVG